VHGQPSSSQEQNQDGAEQLLTRLRIATEVAGLVYMIYVMWILLVPEHRRRLILMRAAAAVRTAAAAAASRTARQAMGLEISGHAGNYEIPYRLAQLRDAAGRVYDKLRYTG
jgi:hypothetical protein